MTGKYLKYKDVVPEEPCLPGVIHYYIRVGYYEAAGLEICVLIEPYINGPKELPWYEYFLSGPIARRIKFKRFPEKVRESILYGIDIILQSKMLDEGWKTK